MGNHLRLHEDKVSFKDAVQAAANHFRVRDVFVEKDYWVTFVLKALSESEHADHVVFKGGTSISKAYGIAKRFSEDIDLALIADPHLKDDENALRMATIESVIALAPLEEDLGQRQKSSNNFYRQTHWKFPFAFERDFAPANEKLKVEFISNVRTDPHHLMPIRSLVAEFLIQKHRDSDLDEFKLREFKVKVLSHKRTFAEKVAAISNAGLADDFGSQLKRQIRHLYDLTLLMKDPVIKNFVRSSEFEQMLDEAREGDKQISRLKEVASKPWRTSKIFTEPNETLKILKPTYESELGELVFDKGSMPKLSEIEKMLRAVSGRTIPKKNASKRKTIE